MPRDFNHCQLCDWTRRDSGMPKAVAVVAGVKLCAEHVERLIEIASKNGVPLSHYLPTRAA